MPNNQENPATEVENKELAQEKKVELPIGTQDDATIQQWKKKHKAVFYLILDEYASDMNPTGETIIGYFRYPTRLDDETMGSAGREEIVAAGLANYKRCFLGGDPRFIDTENNYATVVATAFAHFNNAIRPKAAIIKNL